MVTQSKALGHPATQGDKLCHIRFTPHFQPHPTTAKFCEPLIKTMLNQAYIRLPFRHKIIKTMDQQLARVLQHLFQAGADPSKLRIEIGSLEANNLN